MVSFSLIPLFKCSTHDAVDFKIHLFTGYENSTMFDLTVTWLIFFLQARRILGPQTQGLPPQTIMGPPHQVLSSWGSILYPIQISQSGSSLMSGGPAVISQTSQQVPQPGSMIISHPGQHPSQGPPMVVSQINPHPQAMTGNLAFHGRFP